jgi:hypothetical protein
LLQEYISSSSTGPSSSVPHMYKFQFYAAAEPDNLIEVTIPPPRTDPREGLNTLFKALGIDQLDQDVMDGSHTYTSSLSLREFIPLVHDQYLQDCTDSKSPQVELRTLKTALHFSKGIHVVFSEDFLLQSTLARIDVLRDFVSIASQCPDGLKGIKIGFGNGFTLDPTSGIIWLNAGASPEEWVRFLSRIDVACFHEAKERKVAIHTLSKQVADMLGVGTVCAADDVTTLSEEYEAVLLSMLEHPPSTMLQHPDVCIKFVSDTSDSKPAADHDGVIHIHLKSANLEQGPSVLYQDMYKKSPLAAEQARKARHHRTQMNALKKQVETKLRLRLLSQDPKLKDYQFKAGCLKLLEHARDLTPLLEGLKLRMTDTNAYVPGRQCIDISWSFRL